MRIYPAERPAGVDLEISRQKLYTDRGVSTIVHYCDDADYLAEYRQTIYPNGKESWDGDRMEHQ